MRDSTRDVIEYVAVAWGVVLLPLVAFVVLFYLVGCAHMTPSQRRLCLAERNDQLRRIQQLGMRCETDECRQQLVSEYRYLEMCE